MKVRDWMTTQVETCTPSDDLANASMIMWRRDCGFVPVVEKDTGKLCGVLTDRDICMAVATRHRAPEKLTAKDVMSRAVHTCTPGDDIAAALATMRRRQVRRLPVVEADGRIVGVLAFADLVRHVERAEPRARGTIAPQLLLDALRAIEKPRTLVAPVEAGPSVMAEVRPN